MKLIREELLELSRRMTVKRTGMERIAGAYLDEDGFIDGTFNVNFLKLSDEEKDRNLKLAKAVPFAETNVQLVDYAFTDREMGKESIYQLLNALLACGLKNDALTEMFYELVGEKLNLGFPCAVDLFYGSYDIPRKGADKESQWESEDLYRYIICTVAPLKEEYEPGIPFAGFLFPTYYDGGAALEHVALFDEKPEKHVARNLVTR